MSAGGIELPQGRVFSVSSQGNQRKCSSLGVERAMVGKPCMLELAGSPM